MALGEAFHAITQIRVDDKLCGFGTSWECTSGYDAATSAAALALAFNDIVKPLLLAAIALDCTYEGVYVSSVEPGANLAARLAGDSSIGGRSGTAQPANTCAVITLQTDDSSAVRQGRCYVSGISKSDLVNGTFDPNLVVNELTALADQLANPIDGGGQTFQPRIVQRIKAGVPVGPNLLDITSYRVTAIPYTQRRRTTKQFGTKG